MSDDPSVSASDVSVSNSSGFDPAAVEPGDTLNATRISIRQVYQTLIERGETDDAERLRSYDDVVAMHEYAIRLARLHGITVRGVLRSGG